jgi:aconitate hydratase
VFLRDIWPSRRKSRTWCSSSVKREQFEKQYADVFGGDAQWQAIEVPTGDRYAWDDSSHLREASAVLRGHDDDAAGREAGHRQGRACSACSATPSPPTTSRRPARSPRSRRPVKWLKSLGVEKKDFNSYGARRGNHEVMMRGTFANIRLKNDLTPGLEGWWTRTAPDAEPTIL